MCLPTFAIGTSGNRPCKPLLLIPERSAAADVLCNVMWGVWSSSMAVLAGQA